MTVAPGAAVAFRELEIGYGRSRIAGPMSGSLESGRLWALTGPNGSGKTTLLRTLIGLNRPLAGSVTRAPEIDVSYVPQIGVLDAAFPVNVAEVVGMGLCHRASRSEERRRILEALATVGLEGKGRLSFQRLSGGQRQRVLVARALVADARSLALDEPTSGIDAPGSEKLWELLANIAANKRVVLVATHDHWNVERFAGGNLNLENGLLRECS